MDNINEKAPKRPVLLLIISVCMIIAGDILVRYMYASIRSLIRFIPNMHLYHTTGGIADSIFLLFAGTAISVLLIATGIGFLAGRKWGKTTYTIMVLFFK